MDESCPYCFLLFCEELLSQIGGQLLDLRVATWGEHLSVFKKKTSFIFNFSGQNIHVALRSIKNKIAFDSCAHFIDLDEAIK